MRVAPGEQTKSLAEAERVLRELATLGATRSDHLIALGGGVVGDLAGFAAAVYQRGIPVVQVPTTLVAQVDSAYGGKTGVDLPEAKNYVGAYHLPAAVIADTAALATLPAASSPRDSSRSLKTGLIAGGALWERVRSIETLDPDGARRRRLRLRADEARGGRRRRARRRPPRRPQPRPHGRPRDRGRERLLALPPRRGRRPRAAGGAAPLGRRRAARRGRRDPRAPRAAGDVDRSIATDEIVTALGRDKKRTADGVGFVLLERPGEPSTGRLVEPGSVREAIEELRT